MKIRKCYVDKWTRDTFGHFSHRLTALFFIIFIFLFYHRKTIFLFRIYWLRYWRIYLATLAFIFSSFDFLSLIFFIFIFSLGSLPERFYWYTQRVNYSIFDWKFFKLFLKFLLQNISILSIFEQVTLFQIYFHLNDKIK